MTKRGDTGRSWRTPAKHALMDMMVGQEVGSVLRMSPRFDLRRHVWVDLTAGDAELVGDVDWHRSCSPGILAYHATNSTKPVVIALYEHKAANYGRLLENLTERLPILGYERIDEHVWQFGNHVKLLTYNQSGATARVDYMARTDAVLTLNDPNAITEWAMRDSFTGEISDRGVWAFRSLSTLGCNPAGLKRLDIEERLLWDGSLEAQRQSNPRYRDMLLAAIDGDAAQWAYLISTAGKWRDTTERNVSAAFNKVGRTTATAWARRDPNGFKALTRKLFYTTSERAVEENSQPLFNVDGGSGDVA